jgi:hypothetical protein
VTGGVTDREEYGPVQSSRFIEGLAVPRPPVDGVVGVLAQVRARGTAQSIGHRAIVGVDSRSFSRRRRRWPLRSVDLVSPMAILKSPLVSDVMLVDVDPASMMM